MQRICVYCGSSPGRSEQYAQAAQALAVEMVRRNIGLVYGGANIGIMGTIANHMLQRGGEVIGVLPEFLASKEVAHPQLTELRLVASMHERKAMMAELADGFIALPGGLGTLEELFEILTWAQLGLHSKPCGLLNTQGFYQGLLTFLKHATQEQFISQKHSALLLFEQEPEPLLEKMLHYQAPAVTRWLEAANT